TPGWPIRSCSSPETVPRDAAQNVQTPLAGKMPAAAIRTAAFPFALRLVILRMESAEQEITSMIQDIIAELEARIQKAESVKPEGRAELLQLLSTLRAEIGALSQTHGEDAESIAGFTTVSAHEALREKRNAELMELSLQGLSSSVEQFEESHPS